MISSLVADQIDFDRATYEIAIADFSNTVANRARRIASTAFGTMITTAGSSVYFSFAD